jgi:hypothetical protein
VVETGSGKINFFYVCGLAAGVALLVAWACAGQGWYLLTPPVVRKADRTFMPSSSAPLTNWEHLTSFDSAEQCQVAQAELARKPGPTLRSDHGLTVERAMASADFASRFIALTTHA